MIKRLVEAEKARVTKRYGELNSAHEGYAVLKEEVEEATEDINSINRELDIAWEKIKKDRDASINIKLIKHYAESCINELIQCITVVERYAELEKNK
jgi:nitrate/nitrite-specific signal transduction histidine kinase